MVQQRSFTTYLLLSIITCGIYSIYFWYMYAEDINRVCAGDGEETMNFIVVILLGIVTLGIYPIYWWYKVGNRLQNNAPRYGYNFSENGTTVLLWMLVGSLLCGIGYYYAQYILINNMNTLGDAFNRYNTPVPPMN